MPFVYVPLRQRTFRRIVQWSDLYWFDFGGPESQQRTFAYPHPALVINDTGATLPGSVLIVPLTDASHKKPGYEFHVDLSRQDCPSLDKESIVKTDQIYCISRRPHLPDQYYIATLDTAIMRRIYVPLLTVLNVHRVL